MIRIKRFFTIQESVQKQIKPKEAKQYQTQKKNQPEGIVR